MQKCIFFDRFKGAVTTCIKFKVPCIKKKELMKSGLLNSLNEQGYTDVIHLVFLIQGY